MTGLSLKAYPCSKPFCSLDFDLANIGLSKWWAYSDSPSGHQLDDADSSFWCLLCSMPNFIFIVFASFSIFLFCFNDSWCFLHPVLLLHFCRFCLLSLLCCIWRSSLVFLWTFRILCYNNTLLVVICAHIVIDHNLCTHLLLIIGIIFCSMSSGADFDFVNLYNL